MKFAAAALLGSACLLGLAGAPARASGVPQVIVATSLPPFGFAFPPVASPGELFLLTGGLEPGYYEWNATLWSPLAPLTADITVNGVWYAFDGDAGMFVPVPPPMPTISSPTDGQTFAIGDSVTTSFSCGDGAFGPGAASCVDSNGSSTGAGLLDTSTLGPHTYSVTATSADGLSAKATIGYTVVKAPQAISFTTTPPSPGVVGDTYAVAATGGGSGNPVVFTIDASSSTGVCSVGGSTVSFLASGTCIVDADQAGNDDYLAAPRRQQTITVVALCAPGTYSVTGTEPCSAAPVGDYVDTRGATSATPCPRGTTTSAPGATSVSACHATVASLAALIVQLLDARTAQPLLVSLDASVQSAARDDWPPAANQIGAYLNKVSAAVNAGKIDGSTAVLLSQLGRSIQVAYTAGRAP